jgi:hypothetical protein
MTIHALLKAFRDRVETGCGKKKPQDNLFMHQHQPPCEGEGACCRILAPRLYGVEACVFAKLSMDCASKWVRATRIIRRSRQYQRVW